MVQSGRISIGSLFPFTGRDVWSAFTVGMLPENRILSIKPVPRNMRLFITRSLFMVLKKLWLMVYEV